MTIVRDHWSALRRYTPARVALGRAGVSIPTTRHLEFQEALALARDAVGAELDALALGQELREVGLESIECRSAAIDRTTYLRRPDLGRHLSPESRAELKSRSPERLDVAFVVADGLSAAAGQRHSAALLGALKTLLPVAAWKAGPVVLVHHGRVAVGDEIGEVLRASVVVVLIGERPGLSAHDSLGAYVTWSPRAGLLDSARNCISNIRPGGLPTADAAHSLERLLCSARRLERTGVDLSRALALEEPSEVRRLASNVDTSS